VPGVELRSLWNKGPDRLTANEIRECRARLDGEGLASCCVAAPFYKCRIDDTAAIDHHLDILRRCIDHAQALGAPCVRGFTFWRDGEFDDERLKRVAELYEKPVAILEQMDAILGVENEGSTSVGTGGEAKRFLEHLDHPRVKSLWDTGNSIACPQYVDPYPDDYEAQKPWMVHVHVKDGIRDAEGKCSWLKIGDGQARVLDQLRALKADGYRGWVSLETHWRPKALSEDEVNRPGGATYSREGEFATRACLDVLKRWMEDL
ncbi:MAG: sugar phosphate isomerase/epimerase, partial [Candidatus Sumerlaeota bacterium]|nr:sugar phosphate isomerase/epimerase [Candidatus Sumerlaeota bacterium]